MNRPRITKICLAQNRVPVVLFIHQRVWHLRRVLRAIRAYCPSRLFIFADGWDKRDPKEKKACQAARRLVKEEVDWPCQALYQFSTKKIGLKTSVEKGLCQVFSKVPAAIILEDDCVASPEFFKFCEQNLRRYRRDHKVMSLSGSCFVDEKISIPGRAYLSRYPHCWGWATWKRAWRKYQGELKTDTLQKILHRQFFPAQETAHWSRIVLELVRGGISSWAYFWIWAHWKNGARALTPAVNLVRNIGFDATARHTRELAKPLLVRTGNPRLALQGSVVRISMSEFLDRSVFQNHYRRMAGRRSWWEKITDRLRWLSRSRRRKKGQRSSSCRTI